MLLSTLLITFVKDLKDVVRRMNNRTKVLKDLSGSTWAKGKETIVATYNAIGRPLAYAAPVCIVCAVVSHYRISFETALPAKIKI